MADLIRPSLTFEHPSFSLPSKLRPCPNLSTVRFLYLGDMAFRALCHHAAGRYFPMP